MFLLALGLWGGSLCRPKRVHCWMAKSCKSTATRIYYGEAFEGFVTLNITSKQAISTGSVVASTPKTSPQSKVQSLVASRGSLSISPSYRQGIVRDEKLTRKLNSAARSPRIKNDFQTRLYPRDKKKHIAHNTSRSRRLFIRLLEKGKIVIRKMKWVSEIYCNSCLSFCARETWKF